MDTHIWVWLNLGSTELSSKTIELINTSARAGGVFVSAITVWELATLVSKKRLILQIPITDWITKALGQSGINLLSLSPEVAIESTQLPDGMHGDPADRIIVASARAHQLTLLTRDQKILNYGQSNFVKVMAC